VFGAPARSNGTHSRSDKKIAGGNPNQRILFRKRDASWIVSFRYGGDLL
jgi:hypothetical protein